MTTPARAAIAGNPSDGFGGAVCALIVPDMAVDAWIEVGQSDLEIPLIRATIARFERDVSAFGSERTVKFDSTIPISVGLAGSSGIVIEAVRALCEATGATLTAMELARLAHRIERVDLDIAGGWQDQLIQSHRFSALMDFANGQSIQRLSFTEQRRIPMYLAWSTDAAQPSGVAHAERQRRRDPDASVVGAFARCAHTAAAAFATGDVHALKGAIDESFDLRCDVMDIDAAQHRMILNAREFGACANFAGSGGAIIGVVPKDERTFRGAMEQAGYNIKIWNAR